MIRVLLGIACAFVAPVARAQVSATPDTLVEFFNDPANIRYVEDKLLAAIQSYELSVAALDGRRLTEQEAVLLNNYRAAIAEKRDALHRAARMPLIAVDSPKAGTVGWLADYLPRTLQPVGAAKVVQVVNRTNAIVTVNDNWFWLAEFDASGVTDGAAISIKDRVFQVVGTRTYKTVIGGTKTLYELRPFDVTPFANRAFADREAKAWRTWQSRDGRFSVEAKFVRFDRGKADLQKRDGKTISVGLSQISDADAAYVRAELARRKRLGFD